ncbi:MAG: CBS domain-containing protein, partial [Desulfobacterales bacterium]|nr:CBS domain-containing protein [Desulfobacterales bacterium]
GGSGGIFAPSLFLGAMTGCFFGLHVHALFPDITASAGAYALVAMGGVVAGATHAPITAIIIVFELTNDYQIILPLMIVCIISTILSTKLSRESIYTLKLLRKNINLKDGSEVNIMKSIFVKDVFSKQYEHIPENTKFDDVVNSVITGTLPYFIVTDKKGLISGIVSIHDIKEQLFDRDMLQDIVIARDIASTDVETIVLEDNCQKALDIMAEFNLEGLPVVETLKPRKVLGMIWRKDILDAYNKEIERRDIASTFASRITMKNIDSDVRFMEGHAISELPAPKKFVGKSIKELDIRAKYGVDVILIKSNTESGSKVKAIPNPDYVLSFNDSLVIAGEVGKIKLLKEMH